MPNPYPPRHPRLHTSPDRPGPGGGGGGVHPHYALPRPGISGLRRLLRVVAEQRPARSWPPDQWAPTPPCSSKPSELQCLPTHRRHRVPSLVQALWEGTEENLPGGWTSSGLPAPTPASQGPPSSGEPSSDPLSLPVTQQSLMPGTFLSRAVCTCQLPPLEVSPLPFPGQAPHPAQMPPLQRPSLTVTVNTATSAPAPSSVQRPSLCFFYGTYHTLSLLYAFFSFPAYLPGRAVLSCPPLRSYHPASSVGLAHTWSKSVVLNRGRITPPGTEPLWFPQPNSPGML